MVETLLTTGRFHPKIDPVLSIWDWRIAVYLFLGGLTAGMLCFSAWALLNRREPQLPTAAWRLPLWAPVVLSLGMTTLFLDLEYKRHVFRFYTSFQPTSPMSYGSWVLVLVYPAALALILATLGSGYPGLAQVLGRWKLGRFGLRWADRYRRPVAAGILPLGIALGIYTGILLSGFSARPLWNSAVLGPLFLVSGLSTAAAFILLWTDRPEEHHFFLQVDLGLLVLELALVGLWILGLATGARMQQSALSDLLQHPGFWFGFLGLGLLVPLVWELWAVWKGGEPAAPWRLLPPLLVLLGGLLLRQVLLEVGQAGSGHPYALPFDPALLERLETR